MPEYILDETLKSLEVPSPEHSDESLEESIRQFGCLSPVVVWTETNTLIDGYRRVRICESLGLTPPVVYRSFTDMDTAAAWAMSQQRVRRNLTKEQLIKRREYEAEKIAAIAGRFRPPVATESEASETSDDSTDTEGKGSARKKRQVAAEATRNAAKRTGVSDRTVRRDVKAAETLGRLPEKVREAAKSLSVRDVSEVSKAIGVIGDDAIVTAIEKSNKDGVPFKKALQESTLKPEDVLALEFEEIAKILDSASFRVRGLNKTAELAPIITPAVSSRIIQCIKDAKAILSQCTPVTHGRCMGIGCPECSGRGWTTKGSNKE
jgi:ParB-like chromosome segregation protein Spo0J